MDAVVYDIDSQALLFRAAGESTVNGHSSPLNVEHKKRIYAAEGFDKATESLIENLHTALARFDEQARSGTVQGPGTPAIAMYSAKGERITVASRRQWGRRRGLGDSGSDAGGADRASLCSPDAAPPEPE